MEQDEETQALLLDILKSNYEVLEQIEKLKQSRSSQNAAGEKHASLSTNNDHRGPTIDKGQPSNSGDTEDTSESQGTYTFSTLSDGKTQTASKSDTKRPIQQNYFDLTPEMKQYSRKLRCKSTRSDEDNRVCVKFSLKLQKENTVRKMNDKDNIQRTKQEGNHGKTNVCMKDRKQTFHKKEDRFQHLDKDLLGATGQTTEANTEEIMVDDYEAMWCSLAQQELAYGERARSVRENGMDTIFCLDISASMAGEPLKQAKTFIKGFIEGIQNTTVRNGVYEHVGLVTFGSKNGVQQHMTCDYLEILRKLKMCNAGGSSPLYAGILLTLAAVRGAGQVHRCSGYKIYPRVFLITDGKPTPGGYIGNSDDFTSKDPMADKRMIVDVLMRVHKDVPIQLNVVPVGNSDLGFLQNLAKITGGKSIMADDWASQTRTFKNYIAVAQFGDLLKSGDTGLESIVDILLGMPSDQDKIEMKEFLERHKKETEESDDEELPDLPPLGTRVKRNLAYYSSGTSDPSGTVTCHFRDGHLGITWDDPSKCDDIREKVMYRPENRVTLCNTPRVLKDELIAPGCRVKRGKDWRYPDQDGGPGKLGTVFHVDSQGIIKVRWDIGRKNTYRYGQDGIYFDVEIVNENKQDVKSDSEHKRDAPSDRSLSIVTNVEETAIDSIEEMNKRNLAHNNNSPRLVECDKNKYNSIDKSNPPETSKVQWSWVSNGVHQVYPEDICKSIETSYRRNPKGTTLVEIEGKQFRIIFSRMEQVQTDTKEKFTVCRK